MRQLLYYYETTAMLDYNVCRTTKCYHCPKILGMRKLKTHKLWTHYKFIGTEKIRTSYGHILNSLEPKKLELLVNNEFILTFRALVIAVHKKLSSY